MARVEFSKLPLGMEKFGAKILSMAPEDLAIEPSRKSPAQFHYA